MRKILALVLPILFLIPLAAGCAKSSPPLETDESNDLAMSNEPIMDPLTLNQVGFDFAFFRSIASQDQSANVVLSPISAKIALAMAYNGASGEAREAMAKVLQLEGLDLDQVDKTFHDLIASLEQADPKVELEIADSLWANNFDFYPEFLARCQDNFGAALNQLDFNDPKTVDAINAWVSDKTKGKIDNIIDKLDPEDLFVLLNAVYFNGKWQKAFDKQDTSDQDFHLADGSVKKVAMMKQDGEFSYFENDNFQAVRLPYGDGRLSMYVFLPQEGKDLKGLIENINAGDWSEWMKGFKDRKGHIGLPRFKVEYSKTLNNNLISMGMGPAFQGNAFQQMAPIDGLFIDKVMQKTYIDVNEEGTEAAAVTGVIVGVTAIAPDDSFRITVDHPFLFAITDSATQSILFMGSIVNP